MIKQWSGLKLLSSNINILVKSQKCIQEILPWKLNEGQALQWFTEKDIRNMREEDFSFGFCDVLFDFFHEQPFLKDNS